MKRTFLKFFVIAGLLGFFTTSIALNLFLAERAHAYYLALNASHLDPLGLNVYPTTPQPGIAKQNEKLVVFYGDSRAAQWPDPADMPGYIFVNRGIGNQTSAQVQQRFEAHIRPLQPDILILQVCINDLKTIPLFTDNKATIVNNCKNNIETIVSEAAKLDGIVIVSTIFPNGKVHWARRPFWSPEIETAILEVNTFIHTLAGENVIVFDSYARLVGENGRVLPAFKHDTLHLNDAGYNHLNQSLKQILESNNS
ncbi:MAG: SGNH/GDSL hydrolase family protein [Chloroflexi bacterium]|nr:MAG: SGNH/GDSL hydrolase family protein [Chloroflexota bacterium]